MFTGRDKKFKCFVRMHQGISRHCYFHGLPVGLHLCQTPPPSGTQSYVFFFFLFCCTGEPADWENGTKIIHVAGERWKEDAFLPSFTPSTFRTKYILHFPAHLFIIRQDRIEHGNSHGIFSKLNIDCFWWL